MFERLRTFLNQEVSEIRAKVLLERWRSWRWSNTLLLILSLIVFGLFVRTQLAHEIFEVFKGFSYIGVFIAGLLSPSTFTAVPAYALIFGFANDLNPLLTALVAGSGAMVGDYLIYRFIKNRVFEELAPLVKYFHNERLIAIFHTPYFAWLAPLFGVLLIASPLPDEVGLGMLGIGEMRRRVFLLITFTINTLGILTVVLLARVT